MARGDEDGDEGVNLPVLAAFVGALCAALAAAGGVISAGSPWWSGKAWIEEYKFATVTDSSINLWSFQVSMVVSSQEGEVSDSTVSESWDKICGTLDVNWVELPDQCDQIKAARAMVFLVALFGIVTAVVMIVAAKVQILALLFGALFATFTAVCSLAGLLVGVMLGTSGLTIGVFALVLSFILGTFAVMMSVYGVTKATSQAEDRVIWNDVSRSERVQAAMDDAVASHHALEANMLKSTGSLAQGLESPGNQSRAASVASEDRGPKKPVMLQKVLFWSQEELDENDEPKRLPTKMLELAFREIDEDGSGNIDVEEFIKSLAACGLNASKAATEQIMNEIDKNASGDIDIHEFVGFFRQIEDLNRFGKRSAQRAQFATFLMNCCFLGDIIVVAVLLMFFINMEKTGDDYVIVKNILLAASVMLGGLFLCVIALPGLRLTLGPSVEAWQSHYGDAVQDAVKRRRAAQAARGSRSPKTGPRAAALGGRAPPDQPAVNAAIMGGSYRINKVQAFVDEPPPMIAAPQEDVTLRHPMVHDDEHDGPLGPPGIVVDEYGELQQYSPDAYAQSRWNAQHQRVATSFMPLQVRDLELAREEGEQPGRLLALTAGNR